LSWLIAYLGGFSRDVRLVLLVHALVGLVSLGVNAVLLNLYLLRLGYGPQDIGLINAFGPLCYALSSLPAGALGGRWGVRRLMLAGTGLWSAGVVLVPLAETLPVASPMAWILTAQVLAWAGAATFFVNAVPFFIAATPAAERSHVFSATTALIPLASFAGNLVGGLLPGIWAFVIGGSLESPMVFRYSLFSAALLSTTATMAVLSTSQVRAEVTATTATEASSPLPWKLITFLSMIALLASAGGGILQVFFTLYLDASLQLPTALIGLLAGMAQLTAVPAALAMPALARHWGNENTYILGALGMVVSMLLLALVPHWAAAATGRMGLAAFMAISGPALTVYQQAKVGPRWRAAMSGSANTAMGLSWAGMALGGGYMVAGLGYQTLFTLGASLSAAGALLFFAYTRFHLSVEGNYG
jgi:MFS family permease